MKLASAIILSMLHYSLATGFRLGESREFERNGGIETEKKGVREVDNNTNIIKRGNNWKTKEMEEISQSERRENLKPNGSWMKAHRWSRYQTIPDQFYDYIERSRRHLKEIEAEKIAKENKKLENILVADENVGGIGTERGIRFRRRQSPGADGDSIKDFLNKSELRDYENASSGDVFYSTKTKKGSSALSDSFIGKPKDTFNRLGNKNHESDLEINTTDEQKHISEIKEEVNKLQNLVQILRDQQYILRLLDEVNHQHVINKVNSNPIDLNQPDVLEFTTSTIFSTTNSDENGFEMNDDKFNKHHLHAIEQDIKMLKVNFNHLNNFVRTHISEKIDKEIIFRRNMRMSFVQELKQQRGDLLNTKRQIFQILKKLISKGKFATSNPNGSETVEKGTEFNAILSELKALEKNISRMLTVNSSDEIVGRSGSEDYFETSLEDPISPHIRASIDKNIDEEIDTELDDLLETLDENVSKKNSEKSKVENVLKQLRNIQSKKAFKMLSEELDANDVADSDEQISEILLRLIKFLNNSAKTQKKENQILNILLKNNKRNDNKIDEKELIRLLGKILNEPESKSINSNRENTDVMVNLKKLAEEIEKLRGNQEIISEEDQNDESENFETLLQKLIRNSTPQTTPKPNLTNSESLALIKKLLTMVNKDNVDDNGRLNDKVISFDGTYKCEKLIEEPIIYDQYDTIHPRPPYEDFSFTSQKFPQRYKPHSSYSSPYITYGSDYDPNLYQYDYNSRKLFRDYKNAYLQQPNYFPMLPNSPQHQYNFERPYAPKYPPSASEYSSDYANERIRDLKNQVNNLKAIITNLNRPEYTQREEDRRALFILNQQVDALKDIIRNLAHEDNYNGDAYYQSNESYNDAFINQPPFEPNPMANQEVGKLHPNLPQASFNTNIGQISEVHNPLTIPNVSTRLILKNKNLMSNKDASGEKINTVNNVKINRRRRSIKGTDTEALSELLVRILKDGLKDDENFQKRIVETEDFDIEKEDEEVSSTDFERTVSFGQQRAELLWSNLFRVSNATV
ncbi:hypothetical protein Trydic_g3241 [Trypoxylus dichotomus]